MGASLYIPSLFPAPDASWIGLTPQNGWSAYGQGFPPPQAMRSAGVVHLRGLLAGTTAGASTEVVMFTLPPGYWPDIADNTQIHLAANSNNQHGSIGVYGNGTVHFKVGSPLWFSLDGVSFGAGRW
ncbi:hypothetical protein RHODO2019_10935 [Rhodococcus antarcticus]|uniref:Uncharacterized protein n=1 Tax=Rhodococcus antarcticus TaxID=2987751 RepID=A0ABY6NWF0_9NOCA|nr:hypothetical protein [Rhodococcus antarcticus]UZJ23722.1 hypothetical protein RHODO2019_10935 [Rhodococcus antarcticus]